MLQTLVQLRVKIFLHRHRFRLHIHHCTICPIITDVLLYALFSKIRQKQMEMELKVYPQLLLHHRLQQWTLLKYLLLIKVMETTSL